MDVIRFDNLSKWTQHLVDEFLDGHDCDGKRITSIEGLIAAYQNVSKAIAWDFRGQDPREVSGYIFGSLKSNYNYLLTHLEQ